MVKRGLSEALIDHKIDDLRNGMRRLVDLDSGSTLARADVRLWAPVEHRTVEQWRPRERV